MFPADLFPPAYCEERLKADEAKRKEQEHAAALKQAMGKLQQQQQQQQQQAAQTGVTGQPRLQRPPLSRPGSNGFFGNMWQGFVKTHSPTSSGTSTPATAGNAKLTPEQAERMLDADICVNAMRPW
ncbi:hypothetical protein EJ03DRAFT_356075 [Teratosphaeria nubilosa]|uniref:Uncharacterized protein n=1 Tax=Teratosphaeria nubilosa TaxID=161662 RepID=A0A6G1KUV3_9PEZI|nr:hypothetical protein EJ03DRAFT_356075 [Teratosphaeria nubilosa]